jgi:hypothetical protein
VIAIRGIALRCRVGALLAGAGVLFAFPPACGAAVITGSVIGEGARPIAGATVAVVRHAAEPPCAATTAADGSFALTCSATGRYAVRASAGDLRPWQIDDVELGPERSIHLNFMLLPATGTAAAAPSDASAAAAGFWSRPVPNPVLATWGGHAVTLRVLAAATACVAFVLGAATVIALGRRFGVETRRLSAGEVGDMILNPHMPTVGERVTPVAVAGARGAAASVSYGADEIAAALAAGRYGVVFVALAVVPGLFAVLTLAMAVAMLVNQEWYLLLGMLLVPAGFLLTAVMIGAQAWTRSRNAG